VLNDFEQPLFGHRNAAAVLAVALLVPAALLTAFGPGSGARASAWPQAGLTLAAIVLAGGWLAAVTVVLRAPLGARPGWRVAYYLGLLLLLSTLVGWSQWYMLVSWTACVYAFALFEARWAFFAAAAAGLTLTAAQARSVVPSSRAALPLFLLSLVAPLLVGGWQLGQESSTRRRLINELAAANSELQAKSAANARLRERLLQQARAAGVQQERERMAREIHDTLAQDLSAVVAQLEVALAVDEAAAGGARNGQWRRPVTQARDVAREGMSEARRSVRALASPLLDGAPLPDALGGLARRWEARTGIAAACHTDADLPPLPRDTQAALLRVAQAALANVAEHAGASQVRITLSHVGEAVLLDVWDDGAGFDPARPPAEDGQDGRGFGLTGMRQRLEPLGGRLHIESTPGQGSVICARVPVSAVPTGRRAR
jgi:signal transduction histidine kinase